jgi:hypothetical protein
MRNRLPSPALIIAVLALVVALGGTSYAALKLGKNTVGAKQLKKGAVRSKKVADGSLLARDFKAGQLPAGAPGPQGQPGAKGDPGEQGVAGPAGPTQGEASGYLTPPPTAKTLAFANQLTITTKSAGSVFVTANLSTSLSGCPGPDDCVAHYGLYIDGNAVPGSKTEVGFGAKTTKAFQNLSVVGIAPDIPAGSHHVELRLIDLPQLVGGQFNQDFGSISAVLLGS